MTLLLHGLVSNALSILVVFYDSLLFIADSDGDRVVMSSDDELTDALDQFDGTVFKIHVKSKHIAVNYYH